MKSGLRVARRGRVLLAVPGLAVALLAHADATLISVGDASASADTATTLAFPVTRSGDLGYDTYLSYHTADGSAQAGTDYTATSGSLLIPSGTSTSNISVPVAAGSGADRTLKLLLDGAAGVGSAPRFGNQQQFAAGAGPRAAAVADLNGDGRPDLVVTTPGSSFPSSRSLAVLLNTTAPGAAAPSFAAPASFATGPGPAAVAIADLNGDGRPDLVVVDASTDADSGVSVLLNTTVPGAATPSFAAQQTFAAGFLPVAVSVADLNGDGRPDLVVANRISDSVSVLFNTTVHGAATPSFAAQQSFTAGDAPVAVVTADVNGDGRPDLVVANHFSSNVSVLLNITAAGAATPRFADQEVFAVDFFVGSVAAADVNGDGRPDLLVVESGRLAVLLNTTPAGAALPSFGAPQTVADDSAAAVSTADLNGDGRPDVLVARPSNQSLSVFVNTTIPGAALASFGAEQSRFFGSTGAAPDVITAADLNGDGRPDLLFANGTTSSTVSALLNTTPASAASLSFAAPVNFPSDSRPGAVVTADVNRDGRPDLVFTNLGRTFVSVLLNTSAPGALTPSFAARQDFPTGSLADGVAVADLDGDGRPDLLVLIAAGASSTIKVRFNTTAPGAASASFGSPQVVAAFGLVSNFGTADINGDGRPDLLVATPSPNAVLVLLNTTTPGARLASFAAAQSFAAGDQPAYLATADLNGDGRPDLLVANNGGTGTVSVLFNTTAAGAAAPSFAAAQSFTAGDRPGFVSSADLNGDGRPDLLASSVYSNSVSVLLNTTAPGAAAPAFAAAQNLPMRAQPGSVVPADVDGDGRPDLLVNITLDGAGISVLRNTTTPGAGVSSFAAERTFPAGDQPHAVAAADLNGDGALDLIAANFGSGNVSVLLNTRLAAQLGAASATGTIHYPAGCKAGTLVLKAQVSGSSQPVFVVDENAGSAIIAVSRIGGSCGPAAVNYGIGGGSAVSGVNYDAVAGTLNWSAGDAADKTFRVPIRDDNVYAATLFANIGLSGASGASLGSPSQAMLRIRNVDARPTVDLRPASQSVAKSSGKLVRITAVLSRPSDKPVTLSFVFSGSAVRNRDFAFASDSAGEPITTIEIPAGRTSGRLSVSALNLRPSTPATLVATLRAPGNGAELGSVVSSTVQLLAQ